MLIATRSGTYRDAGTTIFACIKHVADMHSVWYCMSAMHADFFKLAWASLGEPLQTLSELVMWSNEMRNSNIWGEPERAPHLRVRRLPAYASGVDIYVYIYICLYSIFRPTIWPTFSMSCAIVCLFEGSKHLQRRSGRTEEDVDALFETSDATFRSRRRLFRLRVRPL